MAENALRFVRTTASIDAMAVRIAAIYSTLIELAATPGRGNTS
jgi:hypothetical protein